MRSLASLLVLSALSACATAAPHSDTPHPDAPLATRLSDEGAGVRVNLTAPAYLALFRVVPGEGITMLYPREGDRPLLERGWTTLTTPRARRAQFSSADQRAFLVAVASREPLEVEQFWEFNGIRDVIGRTTFESEDLEAVIEALEVAVMGSQVQVAGASATDVLAPWNRRGMPGAVATGPESADRARQVTCRDGSRVTSSGGIRACVGAAGGAGGVRNGPRPAPTGQGGGGAPQPRPRDN